MRRIRLPLGRRLFVVVATLVALLLTVPLRLAAGALGLAQTGISARAAEGSVWSGRLVEARVAGVPLGDLGAGLRPLPLVAGRARIDLATAGETDDAADASRAGVTLGRHQLALEDATLRLPVARLFAPLPVREIALSGVTARFRDGLCDAADGSVRAEIGAVGTVGATPASFAGAPRCDGGALLLPLTSAGGDRLSLRLLGGGRYHAEIALRPGDPETAAKLAATGFTPTADGSVALAVDGSW